MAPTNSAHTRSHSLLLLQKLLNLRDGASPLTLLLDSLEQTAKPALAEFITRAKVCQAFPLPYSRKGNRNKTIFCQHR